MNKTLLIVTLTLAAVAATGYIYGIHLVNDQILTNYAIIDNQPIYDAWMSWKQQYGKKYGGTEQENYKRGVFATNVQKITLHNSNPNKSHTLKINQFGDLSNTEFKAKYLATKVETKLVRNEKFLYTDALPASVDWRNKGVLNAVKDQGQCGSCWAFSATGAIEGAFGVFGTGLVNLSEQQLVDCSGSYGNQGCNGGLMDQAFSFAKDKGLFLQAQYPYKAVDQSCQYTAIAPNRISSWTDVAAGNVDQLAAALVGQPIAVAVDAETWQFYSSGILSSCGSSLDHGVLLVAYTADYWTIKNSWAATWGEAGFIRLARGNTCGLANMASFPNL